MPTEKSIRELALELVDANDELCWINKHSHPQTWSALKNKYDKALDALRAALADDAPNDVAKFVASQKPMPQEFSAAVDKLLADDAPGEMVMAPILEIAAERRRQIEKEGWTQEHDDEHTDGSLASAAASYALPEAAMEWKHHNSFIVPYTWPRSWDISWWKPKDRRRNLIRAGALIVAEIERLDRLAGQREGMERAAEVCDSAAENLIPKIGRDSAARIAHAIRKLKDET